MPERADAVGRERTVPGGAGAGEAAALLPAGLRGGGQGGPPARSQVPPPDSQTGAVREETAFNLQF